MYTCVRRLCIHGNQMTHLFAYIACGMVLRVALTYLPKKWIVALDPETDLATTCRRIITVGFLMALCKLPSADLALGIILGGGFIFVQEPPDFPQVVRALCQLSLLYIGEKCNVYSLVVCGGIVMFTVSPTYKSVMSKLKRGAAKQ